MADQSYTKISSSKWNKFKETYNKDEGERVVKFERYYLQVMSDYSKRTRPLIYIDHKKR